MEKRIEKKIVYLLTVFLMATLSDSRLLAQANWCSVQNTFSTQGSQSVSQPTNCVQLIKDLAPTSTNDPVLQVNVNFVVFAPTTNSSTSIWTHTLDPTTASDASICLDVANSTFTNIPSVPQLTVLNGPTGFTNAKIKLVLKGFQIVNNNAAYNDVTDATYPLLGLQWHDPNAINVFLGTMPFGAENIGAVGTPGIYPMNTIHFTQAFFKDTLPQVRDNIRYYGVILAHEIGHILGLEHPLLSFTSSTVIPAKTTILPSFGCCSHIEPNDHVLEAFFACGTCGPQQKCDSIGNSDNLMCQATGCNRYLSPQQAGVMHYNLRTILKNFLSVSGSTAALNTDPAFDYSVTTNETWTTDRYFKGNITVKTNKSLTIKCGVAMTKGAKIIVEPGGLLTVDGGTITNISGRLWDGIHLQGNPTFPQLTNNPNNPGSVLYQGMLRIKNGGTISQAAIGARNYYNTSGGGGVIFAQNANFINNVVDVQMIDPYTGGSINPVASASWFYHCNFKTTGVIGDANGASYVPNAHVVLFRVRGVKFRACNFQYTANLLSAHGDGIYSVDARYTVDKNLSTPCVFENLWRGIYVNNVNPLKVPVIANTKFVSNTFGGYFMNAYYLAFQTNTIQSSPVTSALAGVYLNKCKYFKIRGNVFEQPNNLVPSDPGISVYQSKTGAHEIFRNTFSRLFMGINCMDDNGNATNQNDGLKMNCNKFNIIPNSYDVVLSYSTGLALPRVLTNQGEINSLFANQFNVVRNIYGATCNNNQNKWQIYSGSTVTINHGSNTNTLTAVTQPTASGCKSALLNVVNKNINLDYPIHCSLFPPSSGGTSTISGNRVASMNDYIINLRADEIATGAKHHFEIQSTVASKLNLFLTDSLTEEPDSVISVLQNNQGNMEDADIQTVFAYMNKNDYTTAQEKVTLLSTNRADWKALLTKLIQIEQDPDNTATIIASNGNFFPGYADTDNKDGQAAAQALLQAYYNVAYNEPHALPEGEGSGARMMAPEFLQSTVTTTADNSVIHIYPNPTQTGVNIAYSSPLEGDIKIELKDLLGKVIYTNFSSGKLFTHYVPVEQLNQGIYLITLTRGKEIVYSE